MSASEEDPKKAEMEAFVEQVAELAAKKVLSQLDASKDKDAMVGTPTESVLLAEIGHQMDKLCLDLGINVAHDLEASATADTQMYLRILDSIGALRHRYVARSSAGLQPMPDMFSLMNAMLGSGTPIGRGHIIIDAR